MKCENCTKYDDCRTGSGLTWPCGAYRPKTGGGMDIEKLIERLNQYSQSLIAYKLGADFADACMEAATALSTLQAENEKLRAEAKQMKRERDAAVKVIERVRSCKDCWHYTGEWTPPCKECQDSEEHHPYFKWRGQKED